ncbi:hypothetical protein ACO1KB_19085 [Leptospira interrogans serovar Szwajizak]|uniref:hypothetical protein n=1 Tax=Leptospira interrogans TaxID=173 RepID=UPI00034B1725|nr:hypothetical protein [Leptospira interrogans]
MNVSSTEVTYSNLLSQVESFLKARQRPYITKPGMENRALNQFMLANIPAQKVLDLIEKLIDIRRHPKLKTEPYWMSATENVSGAYSYMQKIESVHFAIWPEAEKRKEEKNLKDPKLGWKAFLEFSKQLNRDLFEEIKNLPIKEIPETKAIQIPTCTEKAEMFITKFFSESGWKIIKVDPNADNI